MVRVSDHVEAPVRIFRVAETDNAVSRPERRRNRSVFVLPRSSHGLSGISRQRTQEPKTRRCTIMSECTERARNRPLNPFRRPETARKPQEESGGDGNLVWSRSGGAVANPRGLPPGRIRGWRKVYPTDPLMSKSDAYTNGGAYPVGTGNGGEESTAFKGVLRQQAGIYRSVHANRYLVQRR